MMFWSEEVPKTPKVTYNNESIISSFIYDNHNSNLNTLCYFESESSEYLTSISIHTIKLLEPFLSKKSYIEWLYCSPRSSYLHIGNGIRNTLYKIWSENYSHEFSSEEKKLLSTYWCNTETPKEFFRQFINPLLQKIFNRTIIIFIDARTITSIESQKLKNIELLCKELCLAPSTNTVKVILLGENGIFSHHEKYRYTFTPPTGNEKVALDKIIHSSSYEIKESFNTERASLSLSDKQTDFVRTIISVNRPTLKKAIKYIKKQTKISKAEFERLFHTDLIQESESGSITLLRKGLLPSNLNIMNPNEGQKIKILARNAEVLSFSPLYDLSLNDIQIKDFKKLTRNDDSILSGISQYLSPKNQDRKKYLDLSLSLIKESGSNHWLNNSGLMMDLINYLSILITSSKIGEEKKSFTLLEEITTSYANQLHMKSLEGFSDVSTVISRLYTKLGFVFDSAKFNVNRSYESALKRKEIYCKAHNHLLHNTARKFNDEAKVRYWKAWQKYDSEKRSESSKAFIKESEYFFENIGKEPYAKDFCIEMLNIARVIMPESSIKEHSKVFQYFNSYMSLYIPIKYKDLFDKIWKSKEVKSIKYYLNKSSNSADVIIYVSIYDISAALYCIDKILNLSLCNINIKIYPANAYKEAPLEIIDYASIKVIIGAPDTPGALGEIVNMIAPEINPVYQIKSTHNFNLVTQGINKSDDTFIISGCGIRSNLDGIDRFVSDCGAKEKIINLRESKKVEEYISEIMKGVVSKGGKKVVELMVNKALGFMESNKKSNDKVVPSILEGKLQLINLTVLEKESLLKLNDNKETTILLIDSYSGFKGLPEDDELRAYIESIIESCDIFHRILSKKSIIKSAKAMEFKKSFLKILVSLDNTNIEFEPDKIFNTVSNASTQFQHLAQQYKIFIEKL